MEIDVNDPRLFQYSFKQFLTYHILFQTKTIFILYSLLHWTAIKFLIIYGKYPVNFMKIWHKSPNLQSVVSLARFGYIN